MLLKQDWVLGAATRCLLICACACTADERDPDDSADRMMHAVAWRTDTILGGLPTDTLLPLAGPMTADLSGLFVADMYNGMVIHIDTTGAVLWTAGRKGAGPEEFNHIVDMKVAPDGRLWVLDSGNSRVSVLGTDGRFESLLRLNDLTARPVGLLPDSNGVYVLLAAADSPLVSVLGNGLLAKMALPWDSAAAIHPLAGQLTTAADAEAGTLYMAYQLGNGIMAISPSTESGNRRPFVEPIPFPKVAESRMGNAVTTEFERTPTFAARAVSYWEGEVYIHFGGQTEDRLAVLDVYDANDLHYRRSYKLPRRVNKAVVVGKAVYTEFSDPYPTVVRYTLRNEP